ncbi:hypothetical protein AMTRI_Chr08g162430 [Amborella trichopoda]
MAVFLNFCDEDTGKSFTSHLNKALANSSISTFFFSPTQPPSDIQGSMEECKAFIIIVSPNYAFSFFCLDQFSYILSVQWRRPILPVFYNVEPLHDHKTKNQFDEETIQRWRDDLKQVAHLSGFDMKNYGYNQLYMEYKTPIHVAKHPIGLDSRIDDVMTLLDVSADGARMIGIHGMGGIGKSTLAKAVFNNIRFNFDPSCFLSNVREKSQTNAGLVSLQKQLLKELFCINLIKRKIGSKDVPVVIDDVDHYRQLAKLAGNIDWYCKQSRIIITTRDEHVLNVCNRVQHHHIYKTKALDDAQSLERFSWWAFGRDQPMQEYAQLSKDVVSTAGGLPLALEILGNYICDKTTIEEWEVAVAKFKIIPENDNMDYAIDIWKGCGFIALNSIERLLQRSLIKIDDEDNLWMHDQLCQMGRWFVELENLDDPGRRSRLWSQDQVIDVLRNHKGSSKVRGLIPKGKKHEHNWETEAFRPMTNLKLLSIRDAYLNGRFKSLLSELVWLKWQGCPLQCLPYDFSDEKLVVLDLSNSKAIQDLLRSDIKQPIQKLKVLDLSYCEKLERIPNCSLHPKLKKLKLRGCSKLVEIPISIGLLGKLVFLDLKGYSTIKELPTCSALKELPSSISRLHSLEKLILYSCHKLKKLPEQLGSMHALMELDRSHSGIAQLPDSIGNLTNLRKLYMRNTMVREPPHSLGALVNLEVLIVSQCKVLSKFPASMERMTSLHLLNMEKTAVATLPNEFGYLSNLESLYMSECEQLKEFRESFGSRTSSEFLHIPHNINLTTLSSTSSLNATKLLICECRRLEDIPDLHTSLEYLDPRGCQCLLIVPKPSHLSKLERLDFSDCKRLFTISDLPATLKTLYASNCNSLQNIPNLSHLSQLEVLDLTTCTRLTEIQGLSGLKSLRALHLSGRSSQSSKCSVERSILVKLQMSWFPMLL